MIVTSAQHELIHQVLDRMVVGTNGRSGYLFIQQAGTELGCSKEESYFLRSVMQEEGLVTNHDGLNQNGISQLTPLGQSIAKAPGGYLGRIEAQIQQKEAEQRRINEQHEYSRQSATGTVSSARSAKLSMWFAGGSFIVAVIATIIAYWAASSSGASTERIENLEKQMHTLQNKTVAE